MTQPDCDHPEGLRLTGYHRPEESQAFIADMQCPVCEAVLEVRTDRTAAELDALMVEQYEEPAKLTAAAAAAQEERDG
jgi:hypothetical protein